MEKEFKGTKGSWKREDTADYAMIKSDGNDVPVALVANSDDANLIAAAPELLQALQDLVAQFKKVSPLYTRDAEIISQAESAINSALNIK